MVVLTQNQIGSFSDTENNDRQGPSLSSRFGFERANPVEVVVDVLAESPRDILAESSLYGEQTPHFDRTEFRVATFQECLANLTHLSASPTGDLLLTLEPSNRVTLWNRIDAGAHTQAWSFDGEYEISHTAFSPDGKNLIIADDELLSVVNVSEVNGEFQFRCTQCVLHPAGKGSIEAIGFENNSAIISYEDGATTIVTLGSEVPSPQLPKLESARGVALDITTLDEGFDTRSTATFARIRL